MIQYTVGALMISTAAASDWEMNPIYWESALVSSHTAQNQDAPQELSDDRKEHLNLASIPSESSETLFKVPDDFDHMVKAFGRDLAFAMAGFDLNKNYVSVKYDSANPESIEHVPGADAVGSSYVSAQSLVPPPPPLSGEEYAGPKVVEATLRNAMALARKNSQESNRFHAVVTPKLITCPTCKGSRMKPIEKRGFWNKLRVDFGATLSVKNCKDCKGKGDVTVAEAKLIKYKSMPLYSRCMTYFG